MSDKKYGWAKLICIDQSRYYIFWHPREFKNVSKYSKLSESRIIGTPASCSYYSSMNNETYHSKYNTKNENFPVSTTRQGKNNNQSIYR